MSNVNTFGLLLPAIVSILNTFGLLLPAIVSILNTFGLLLPAIVSILRTRVAQGRPHHQDITGSEWLDTLVGLLLETH